MSNAAVIKLQKKEIGGKKIWLDDNWGESIHLHINDFRIDMTCMEFEKICSNICDTIDDMISIKGYDTHSFDPVFLEQILWKRLLDLEKIKIDQLKLSELYVCDNSIQPIEKSRLVKALNGKIKNANKKRRSDHIGQSGLERLEMIQESIQQEGYQQKKGYIVVFGDDNVIRDGQHRACCLWKEKGDISVPIMRMYFKNYRQENLKISSFPIQRILYAGDQIKTWIKKPRSGLIVCIKECVKILRKFDSKLYSIRNRKTLKKAFEILGEK